MKIKNMLIGMLMLAFMIQLVNAAEVCVVADYGNGEVDSKCIDIDEGKNGYELLEEIGWDILWSPESIYGHMVCKINDAGTEVSGLYCEYGGDSWNLALIRDRGWLHMPVGVDGPGDCWNYDINSFAGHYCTKDGDVVGFSFGSPGSKPEMFRVNISKVYIDGDKQRESKTRGGKIVDVFPESEVKIKIEFENLYHHSTDIDITDVSIEANIEDINNGDDIDVSVNEFDLNADKETTKDLEFTIPLEVKAKDRLLRIEVKAEDDAGIEYEYEFTFDLEVEKEKHNVKITSTGLNKESYKCGENALLSVSVLNVGDNNEDVKLRLTNSDLNVDITKSFKLTDDVYEASSKYEERFNIWLPDALNAGNYPVAITADYDGDDETKTVELVIGSCDKTGPVSSNTGSNEQVTGVQSGNEPEQTNTEAEQSESDVTITEITISKTPLILVGVFVFLIVAIVTLGIIFFVVRK